MKLLVWCMPSLETKQTSLSEATVLAATPHYLHAPCGSMSYISMTVRVVADVAAPCKRIRRHRSS